jgi:nitrate reductase NapE component
MATTKKAPAKKKTATKKTVVAEQNSFVTVLVVIFALLSAVFVWLAYSKYGL